MPIQSAKDVAIIRANRSAVLQHLKLYRLALIDIECALKMDYPKDMQYKLHERKARIYLALKKHADALDAFKRTISTLSDCKLPLERKQQLQMDAQIMVGMLSKDKNVLNSKQSDFNLDVKKVRSDYLPELTAKCNTEYPNASELVKFEFNENLGRYAVANNDIQVGDTLIVEKAACSVLLSNYSLTHCQHCFLKLQAPIACDSCANVIFCSELCKTKSKIYHNHECGITQSIWDSGISIICLMALRFITERNQEYFQELYSSNCKTQNVYNQVLTLVTHSDKRSQEDFFHRSIMALYLMKCLEQSNYFTSDSTIDFKYFIGGLIIKHLEILQFNAHEISELKMDEVYPKRVDLAKSIFLGGAIYPTLALFNHSCDPGIIRYFHGTSVIVRAIKNIKKGEMIAENYGPIYTESPLYERKRILKEQYWFDCFCMPCMQNWPTFDNMNPSILRFRCDAQIKCTNIIPISVNTDKFFAHCGLCDQNTNILKGLKSLEETDYLCKKANEFIEKGDTTNAFQMLKKALSIMNEVLAPPFRDYTLCQQGIRRCLLDLGNKTNF
ncbi:SET and MYND domain-containing protein DDB_G0284059 [Chrysoperla carnea]|uniref:SET and MYND domain-containing protein DDB_G0284059 n=1 Tax=Chrysoperla carnea TaxID=189513 RepID=UPI001D08E8DF|nr:SET and MYND domain-containing protein DDB_G0284059 [Chrysoperla carnea]